MSLILYIKGEIKNMLGDKIKQLRLENNLTQKELADKVFVTAQAVSRWEKNEVEPSFATLTELAKIFEVQINEFFDGNEIPEKNESAQPQREVIYVEPKPVLAVCEQCNNPIYDSEKIVRKHGSVICSSCNRKNRDTKLSKDTSFGIKQRKKSFIWGGILSGILFAIIACLMSLGGINIGAILIGLCVAIPAFTLLSCLFLSNTFLPDCMMAIAEWGYVTFPGLIFDLDLDGILWYICVKLLFAVLGYILATITLILAIIVGGFLSLFVYPFAITKAYKHPELCEDNNVE